METNSSTAGVETVAGTVRLANGRTARARRSAVAGGPGVVRYADSAGRARTATDDVAASFAPLTVEAVELAHGVALIEAAGQGVRILTQITVDQHDTAFGDRPWPTTEARCPRHGEQLHGSVDAIRVAVGGQWYELTRVQMPSGERRRFARQYNGYGDGPADVREASMLFGCAWSSVPVVGWTEAEIEAEHEADAERMEYVDRLDADADTEAETAPIELTDDTLRLLAELEAHQLNDKVDAVASVGLPMTHQAVADVLVEHPGVAAAVRPALASVASGNPNCCSHGYRFENGLCPVVVCGASPWTPAPDPPHAAGAGPAVTTDRTDPLT